MKILTKATFAAFTLGFATCLLLLALVVRRVMPQSVSLKDLLTAVKLADNTKDLGKFGNMEELARQSESIFRKLQDGKTSNDQLRSLLQGMPSLATKKSPSKKKK